MKNSCLYDILFAAEMNAERGAPDMLLAIHIGNARITLGVTDLVGERGLLFCAACSAANDRTADEYAVWLGQIFALHTFAPAQITGLIVSSVVPSLTDTICSAAARLISVPPKIVGSGMKTGLRIRIENPAQLGADLVSLAVGASDRIVDSRPCVIVSFDAATALTVLSSPDEVAGAVIMPGLLSSARALERDAALLTEISLELPRRVIGRNTQDALRAGLLYGAVAQVDGLIDRIAEELGTAPEALWLFACGMYAERIAPLCRHRFALVPHLLFEGLAALYRKNC